MMRLTLTDVEMLIRLLDDAAEARERLVQLRDDYLDDLRQPPRQPDDDQLEFDF